MTEVSLEALLRRMSRIAEDLFDQHGEAPTLWLIESPEKGQVLMETEEELVSRKALAKQEQKAPESHSQHRIEGPGALLRKVGQDAELRTARPNNATPADACGRLTVGICRRGLVPALGTAGGACAPIGCRLDRKLRGGAGRWGKYNKVEPS